MGRKYTFHGRVFSGSGKGSYYVGHPEYKKRFLKLLGYVPYPGTLNVKLDSGEEIEERRRMRLGKKALWIGEFRHRGERFSAVNCFRGRMAEQRVALLIVDITHYDDSVLELISPVYLREKLGLMDGSEVSARIDL